MSGLALCSAAGAGDIEEETLILVAQSWHRPTSPSPAHSTGSGRHQEKYHNMNWNSLMDGKSSTQVCHIFLELEKRYDILQRGLSTMSTIVNYYIKRSQQWKHKHFVFPEKWYYKNSSFFHFNSRFVLKTTKTPVFVFINDIFWRIFRCSNWWFIIDVVERLG